MMRLSAQQLAEAGYVVVGDRAVRADASRTTPAPGAPTPKVSPATPKVSRTATQPTPARLNKYGARKTVGEGPAGAPRTYDSAAEARFAAGLNLRRAAGEIAGWVPQVSLEVGTGESGRSIRYRADALEILELRADGTFVARLLDRKGRDTPNSRTKRAALRALCGLDVRLT